MKNDTPSLTHPYRRKVSFFCNYWMIENLQYSQFISLHSNMKHDLPPITCPYCRKVVFFKY